jgi:hypothetical protein
MLLPSVGEQSETFFEKAFFMFLVGFGFLRRMYRQ